MPASANPPCWPGGVAQHERVRGHVPRHHRAHAHHREFTQRDARPNRGVRADGDAAGKSRRERLIGRVGGLEPRQLEVSSPGKTIVGEDGVGGNHAKVFNRYRSANVDACVDLHEASNDDVVSNVGLFSDNAGLPKLGSSADVNRIPHLRPFTEDDSLFHECCWMYPGGR